MKNFQYYRGVRGVHFIWHGTNADPELRYKGKYVNYYLVEDTIWEMFKEEYGSNDDDDELFNAYCRKNNRYIKEMITENGERR